MKKVLLLAFVGAMLALSATAFAADGGHAGHVAPTTPDLTNFVEVKIASTDISATAGATVGTVTPMKATEITSANFSVTVAAKKPLVLGAVTLEITHAAGVISDLTFPAETTMGLKARPAYAWLYNKTTKVYDRFDITPATAGEKMTIKSVALDSYFTTGTVMLGNETSVPSGDSGSSGGCNAAAAPFMLLLGALPLLYFRKK